MGTIGSRAPRNSGGKRLQPRVAVVLSSLALSLWLLHPGDAAALALGRMQGVPTIGQALQLSLPFTVSPGEDPPCVRADLLQGDTPAGRLDWRLEVLDDERRMLRLTSPLPVLEPVITVNIVIGCTQPFSRGFVLLAEPPVPRRESAPLPARPEPAPVTAKADGWNFEPSLGKASLAAVAPAPQRKTADARRAVRTTPRAEGGPRVEGGPRAEGRPRGAGTGGARLSLELLDVAIDQAAALKATGQLAAPVAPGSLPRAQAAAEWKALNTPPTPEVAQALQAANDLEMRQLRELAQRQSDQLARLGHQRDLARDILASLCGAIALGLGVLLWRRTRDARLGPSWWEDEREPERDPVPRARAAPVAAPPRAGVAEDIDSDWTGLGSAAPAPSLPSTLRAGMNGVPSPTTAPVPPPAAGFSDSVLGRGRLPSAEELLDVQERANFFIAIGQNDQAIDLLETRLQEHYGTSPFLWLDLLDLCRKLGRPDDYERVRTQFQKAFAARLPVFEAPPAHSEGLERYPRALSRIALLWGTPKVLREIETSLFEAPVDGAILFDLEASRELLLLYSLAIELVEGAPQAMAGQVSRPPDNLSTQPVPLIDLDLGRKDKEQEQSLNLDVDFSALEPSRALARPQPAPQPAAVPDPVPGLDLDLDLDSLVVGRFR